MVWGEASSEVVNLSSWGFPGEGVAATIPGMDDTLFALPPADPPRSEETASGLPRLQRPNRGQLELRPVDLEGLLPADHRARLVWAFVEGLDLESLYERIRAVEGHPVWHTGDPSSYTCTTDGDNTTTTGIMVAYTGVDPTTPIDATASTHGQNTGTTNVVPGITTVTDGAMLLSGLAGDWSTYDLTPPSGMANVNHSTGTGRVTGIADLVQATAGATGSKTWTTPTGYATAAYLAALRPATGGATGGDGVIATSSVPTTATDNISLEARFRYDAIPSGTAVIAYNGTDAAGWGLTMNGGHLQGLYGSVAWLDTGVAPSAGAWHDVILSRTGGTTRIYLDGVQAGSTWASAPYAPTTKLTIGGEDNGSGTIYRNFYGSVADVAVNIMPLSATDAARHAAAGTGTADTASNLTTATRYDALGRAVSTMSPAGVATRATFDRLGRQTATAANYVNGVTSGPTGDDDVRSTYAYDNLGELIAICPAAQVYAAGCSPTPSAAAATAWHDDYDAAGHQVAEIPPANVTATALLATYSYYDAGGRLTRTCTVANGSNASCAGTSAPHTTYTYDGVGRPVTTTTYADATTVKLVTTSSYDGSGAVTQTAFDGTGSGEGTDTLGYTYDAMGRPDQTKRGSTVLTDNTWNPDDTLASRTDGAAGAVGTSSFTYDWAKRVVTATLPSGLADRWRSRDLRLPRRRPARRAHLERHRVSAHVHLRRRQASDRGHGHPGGRHLGPLADLRPGGQRDRRRAHDAGCGHRRCRHRRPDLQL